LKGCTTLLLKISFLTPDPPPSSPLMSKMWLFSANLALKKLTKRLMETEIFSIFD
jgi:hypothetical protein